MGPIQRQIMVLVDCFDSLNQFAEIVEWTIQARNGGPGMEALHSKYID